MSEVEKALESYRFDLAAQALYEFIWNEYCDWYLELSKPVLWDDQAGEARKTGTRRTLVRVLETTLRLAHPLLPFISEEIWQNIAPMAAVNGDTIMLQPYPACDPSLVDEPAERDIEWLKTVIVGIRSLRAEMNISPATQLPVILAKGTQDDRSRLLNSHQLLCKLGQLESIEWLGEGQKMPLSMTALAGDLEILVPLAGHINIGDELDRLDREIAKLNLECDKLDAKLDKPAFVEKAPPEVVEKERQKLTDLRGANRQLQQRRSEVAGLDGA